MLENVVVIISVIIAIVGFIIVMGCAVYSLKDQGLYIELKIVSIILISLALFITCSILIDDNRTKEGKQNIISQEFNEILKEDNTYDLGKQYLIVKYNKAYIVKKDDYKDITEYKNITEEDFNLLKYTLEH